MGGLTPLQRSSRCILHPQPTGSICLKVRLMAWQAYIPRIANVVGCSRSVRVRTPVTLSRLLSNTLKRGMNLFIPTALI